MNEFNGPMMFVPGSHRDGRIDSDQTFERVPEYGRLSADAVGSPYTNETINGLIEKNGILHPKAWLVQPFFSWMHDTRFRAEYVSLGKGNGLFKS